MKHLRVFLFSLVVLFAFSPFLRAQEDSSSSQSSGSHPSVNVPNVFDETFDATDAWGEKGPSGQFHSPLSTVKKYGKPLSSLGTSKAKGISAVDPKRYRLKPGDTLEIKLWTPFSIDTSDTITAGGTFNFGQVGEIPVKGVLLSQLSSYLETVMKKYYKHPQVNAALVNVGTISVQVLGEVSQPGSYEVPGSVGALDVIKQDAGGLTEQGSLRTIEIHQEGKPAQVLDYAKWQILGDTSQNPYIEANATIFVPVIKNKVVVHGEVKRPGVYEVLPGETWQDLLSLVGGYTPEAMATEAKISRITPNHSAINLPASDSFSLQNGDSTFVPSLSLFQKRIKVIGEVEGAGLFAPRRSQVTGTPEITRVGWYYLHEKEKVKDVVINLGGFTSQADPARSRIERKTSSGSIQIIPVNLQKLFGGNDETQNVALKDGDTLVVPPSPDSIYVMGEVNRPGILPYNPAGHIREYLALAGGPTQHAILGRAKLIRYPEGSTKPEIHDLNLNKLGESGETSKDLLVEPGDVIYIPRTEIAGFTDIVGVLSNIAVVRALFFR